MSALPDPRFLDERTAHWAETKPDDEAIDYLKGVATANVTFTGSVSADVLLDYYRKASVYVQPSLHEGFGLSVAEAMLAGCVPVTTGAGALPEVTGKCGVRLSSPDPAEIAQAIGAPTANRAVGAAVGRNPIAYVVPCHRVIRGTGAIGDYHWGACRKHAILARELLV